MIYLNAGNLWTSEYLDKVIELNKLHKDDDIKVSSLFGSISRMTPTARSFDRIPMLGRDDFEEYVSKAQANDISIRYTLNASCLGSIQSFASEWKDNLKEAVTRIHDAGVSQWTVTSPLLCKLVHEMFPSDFIEVSTIDEVSTPNQALRWEDLGARGICASIMINRDPDAIMALKRTGMEISLLANEACLFRCPMRTECYNLSSHDSLRGEKYFGYYPFSYCNNLRISDPVEWVKSRMIAPQWMKMYHDEIGIEHFKIAYRTHPYEVAVPILELYMNKYHGGNFLDLWPTIRNLGHTDEPAEMTFISAVELDKHIPNLIFGRNFKCNDNACGDDCRLCDAIYAKCAGSRAKNV